MRSQQKLAARLAAVALAVSGAGVAGAATAHADAYGYEFWPSGMVIDVPSVPVPVGGGKTVESPPFKVEVPAGRLSFGVSGSALNVTKFRSEYRTYSKMSLERWQVKYSFMKDNPVTKQEEEYAWVWGDEHFTTLPWGRDVVKAPPEGWTAKDRGSVVAQLYVRGVPVPGARVRHQIGLLPGVNNRLHEGSYEAGRLVGKGINLGERMVEQDVRAAKRVARWLNPFD